MRPRGRIRAHHENDSMDPVVTLFLASDIGQGGQQRHRYTFNPRTRKIRVYNPSANTTKSVRQLLALQFTGSPIEGPVSVRMVVSYKRPDSHFNKNGSIKAGQPQQKVTVPDVDNVAKLYLDAMNGKILADDRTVTTLFIKKVYAVGNAGPSTEIEVYTDFGEELRGGRPRSEVISAFPAMLT